MIAWKRYSNSHPPLHLMVAAYLGIKPKPDDSQPLTQEQHAERLISQLTGLL